MGEYAEQDVEAWERGYPAHRSFVADGYSGPRRSRQGKRSAERRLHCCFACQQQTWINAEKRCTNPQCTRNKEKSSADSSQ